MFVFVPAHYGLTAYPLFYYPRSVVFVARKNVLGRQPRRRIDGSVSIIYLEKFEKSKLVNCFIKTMLILIDNVLQKKKKKIFNEFQTILQTKTILKCLSFV